jgi:hypothetical protein
MKINKKLLMLGATFALTAQIGTNAMAANVDGTADVEIVTPLAISQNAAGGLNFGKIAPGPSSGTINVNSVGFLSKTAGPTELQIVDAASASAGIFDITGEDLLLITVVVPGTTSLTANGGSGGSPMLVTLLSNAAATTALDGVGDATLTVSGDLAVGANQAADTYSGTYNVTVFYQ